MPFGPFFGDRERAADPRAVAAELAARLAEAGAAPAGAPRHAALAACLVCAGELAQGVADAEERAGPSAHGPGAAASLAAVAAIGRALWASWRAAGRAPVPDLPELHALRRAPFPEAIRVRRPEGYAFYAVYPEAYAAAAAALAGKDLVVVGLRSIGTGLAAMVAAGAGASARAIATLRPRGPPFRREIALAPALAAALSALSARPGAAFAVADEGPGLSGSSFAAAVDALARLGVPGERVHLFPSHRGGPGPEADARLRRLHASARTHHVPFEALFLGDHPLALARLAEDVIGPAEAPPIDLGAGAWRRLASADRDAWPPSQGWRERRKLLLRAGGRAWVARFAGLGPAGERALSRARALAAAGLAPSPAALRHGFLFEPWLGEATPLPLAHVPRAAVVEAVHAHLAFLAARFPAGPLDGAAPRALLEVVRAWAEAALGPGAAADAPWLLALAAEAEATHRPVAIDGKLQAWEWLVLPRGRLVKADALDHHADHALVGCQDPLWDVAGAELELGLGPGEVERLARAVRSARAGAAPALLPFYRAAYAAFELGRWATAAEEGGLDADERGRRLAAAARYREALRRALAAGATGTRRPPGRGSVTGAVTVWRAPPAGDPAAPA